MSPHPDTQLKAWDDIQHGLSDRRAAVLRHIRRSGPNGATMPELSSSMNVPINRVTGRVNELVRMGLLRDGGRRRVNPSSGKLNIVWELGDPNIKTESNRHTSECPYCNGTGRIIHFETQLELMPETTFQWPDAKAPVGPNERHPYRRVISIGKPRE